MKTLHVSMKKWWLAATALFTLFILAIIIGADTDHLPYSLDRLYRFPGGDKVGHFVLFGILNFLLNRSALELFPQRDSARLILTVSLLLSIGIGLEEWSQVLFPSRTVSLIDLAAGYMGVALFGWLAYRTHR